MKTLKITSVYTGVILGILALTSILNFDAYQAFIILAYTLSTGTIIYFS